jgi:polyhydroxyalkanoate synthesis regulator phasin
MRKGLWLVAGTLLAVTLAVPAVFAASSNEDTRGRMMEQHNQMVEQHVKDGVLTPEQAQAMNEHMANIPENMQSMMQNMGPGMMQGMMQGMMGNKSNMMGSGSAPCDNTPVQK